MSKYRLISGTVPGHSVPPQVQCGGVSQDVIGQNLQDLCTVKGPAGTVTVSSGSGSLLLSTNPSVAGSSSIQVSIPSNGASVSFYAQALAGSGDVTITVSNGATTTITESPSAIILAGPDFNAGPFQNFLNASLAGGPVSVFAETAVVDSTNHVINLGGQSIRGGFSVSATLSSSAPGVGTVTTPVTILAGNTSAAATFTPVSTGSVTITLSEPLGFQTPASTPANSYVTLVGTVTQ